MRFEIPVRYWRRLHYYFSPVPFLDDPPTTALNLTHDVLPIPALTKIARKFELFLQTKPNGFIKLTFAFRGKGSQLSKRGESAECPEFPELNDPKRLREARQNPSARNL